MKKFLEHATTPLAHSVGNTFSDIWSLAIGSHVSLWTEKQKLRQTRNLENYRESIEQRLSLIPEENLTEPQLHILGPAVEASKYYIDSEELREMFARLIASSVDDRRLSETHPSFVEIIKQLSPHDARILRNFSYSDMIAIAMVNLETESKSYKTVQNHIMDFKDNSQFKLNATSLSNLERLGLIKIDYSAHSTDDNDYNFVPSHPAYKEAEAELDRNQSQNGIFTHVGFKKGLCTATPLGESFINICLQDN